jgi:hypothetical protein
MFSKIRSRYIERKRLGELRNYLSKIRASHAAAIKQEPSKRRLLEEDEAAEASLYSPELNHMETLILLRIANKYGIKINPDWFEVEDGQTGRFSNLSYEGEPELRSLIVIKRRENTEWWVKIIVQIITAITGLAGVIIGILAILRK